MGKLAEAEETLASVVARYEARGFAGQFATRPAGVVFCTSCRKESDAAQYRIKALHRFEGVSDPSEEMMVAALECPRCGIGGTLVLTYGPEAPREDGLVLVRLPELRGTSRDRPERRPVGAVRH